MSTPPIPWFNERGNIGRAASNPSQIAPPLFLMWKARLNSPEAAVSDGNRLAVRCAGQIQCIDLHTGTTTWSYSGKKSEFETCNLVSNSECICVHPESCFMMAIAWNNGMLLWKKRAPQEQEVSPAYPTALKNLWNHSGLLIDMNDGNIIRNFETEKWYVEDLLPNGRAWCDRLARDNRAMALFEIGKVDPIAIVELKYQYVDPVAVFSETVLCRSYRRDSKNFIGVWDSNDGKGLQQIEEHSLGKLCLAGEKLVFKKLVSETPFSCVISCFDVRSGKYLWDCNRKFADSTPTDELSSPSDPIATLNYVWYCYRERKGKKDNSVLVALDINTGKVVWTTTFPEWYEHVLAAGDYLIVVARGVIYCFGPEGSGKAAKRTEKSSTAKDAAPSAGKFARRRAVKPLKNGEYPLGNGSALVLKPAQRPQQIVVRDKAGKESQLLTAPGKNCFTGWDVHSAASVAFFQPQINEAADDGQELYVFDGSKVRPVGVAKEFLNCISFAIDPEGKRVAWSFTSVEEASGGHIRVFDIRTAKTLAEWPLGDDTILAHGLEWTGPNQVQFENVNPGHESEGRKFRMNLESGVTE